MKNLNKLVRVPKPIKGKLPQAEYQKIVEQYKQMDQDTLLHIINLHRKDCETLNKLDEVYENSMCTFGFFTGYSKYVQDDSELWNSEELHQMSEHFMRKQDIVQNLTPYAPKEGYNPDETGWKLNQLLRKLRDE